MALCALAVTLWVERASTAEAAPPVCASTADIELLNSVSLGGMDRDPRLIRRHGDKGDGFTANLMLSCEPVRIVWRVYDMETMSLVPRQDTPLDDYVEGELTASAEHVMWDPDGAGGPRAEVDAARYEIVFENGQVGRWFDNDKSMLAEETYLLKLTVEPASGVADSVAYNIAMGQSQGNGLTASIKRLVKYVTYVRAGARTIVGATQGVGCNTSGEAGNVPPDNCDESDAASGYVGALPTVDYARFASIPTGRNTSCYGVGEIIRVEVRFDREIMPVSLSGPVGGEYQLSPDSWAHDYLHLDLQIGANARRAVYSGGFLTHQKSWMFDYRVREDDEGDSVVIGDLSVDPAFSPENAVVHARFDPDKGSTPGVSPLYWYASESFTPYGPPPAPTSGIVIAPAVPWPSGHCVDGKEDGLTLVEELEISTFTGLLIGTPAHLTYEREITARGWRISMNIVYAVVIPIIVAWMGMMIIVKVMVRGQDSQWGELVPRLILALIAAASSYWWLRLLVDLSSGVSQYVAHALSVSPGDMMVFSSKALLILIGAAAVGLIKIFLALYMIFILFGVLIIIQFIVRIVMINLLIMVAPIAIALWALPETANWGRRWLNYFMVTLFQHGLQLMAFALAISFIKALLPASGDIPEATGGGVDSLLWSLLLGIAGFYLTFRLPSMLGAGDVYEGVVTTVYYSISSLTQAPRAIRGMVGNLVGGVGLPRTFQGSPGSYGVGPTFGGMARSQGLGVALLNVGSFRTSGVGGAGLRGAAGAYSFGRDVRNMGLGFALGQVGYSLQARVAGGNSLAGPRAANPAYSLASASLSSPRGRNPVHQMFRSLRAMNLRNQRLQFNQQWQRTSRNIRRQMARQHRQEANQLRQQLDQQEQQFRQQLGQDRQQLRQQHSQDRQQLRQQHAQQLNRLHNNPQWQSGSSQMRQQMDQSLRQRQSGELSRLSGQQRSSLRGLVNQQRAQLRQHAGQQRGQIRSQRSQQRLDLRRTLSQKLRQMRGGSP